MSPSSPLSICLPLFRSLLCSSPYLRTRLWMSRLRLQVPMARAVVMHVADRRKDLVHVRI